MNELETWGTGLEQKPMIVVGSKIDVANSEKLAKLKRLSDWLQAHERKFLFELLVPAESHQLESVGGDLERYESELKLVRSLLEKRTEPQWREFLSLWKE